MGYSVAFVIACSPALLLLVFVAFYKISVRLVLFVAIWTALFYCGFSTEVLFGLLLFGSWLLFRDVLFFFAMRLFVFAESVFSCGSPAGFPRPCSIGYSSKTRTFCCLFGLLCDAGCLFRNRRLFLFLVACGVVTCSAAEMSCVLAWLGMCRFVSSSGAVFPVFLYLPNAVLFSLRFSACQMRCCYLPCCRCVLCVLVWLVGVGCFPLALLCVLCFSVGRMRCCCLLCYRGVLCVGFGMSV